VKLKWDCRQSFSCAVKATHCAAGAENKIWLQLLQLGECGNQKVNAVWGRGWFICSITNLVDCSVSSSNLKQERVVNFCRTTWRHNLQTGSIYPSTWQIQLQLSAVSRCRSSARQLTAPAISTTSLHVSLAGQDSWGISPSVGSDSKNTCMLRRKSTRILSGWLVISWRCLTIKNINVKRWNYREWCMGKDLEGRGLTYLGHNPGFAWKNWQKPRRAKSGQAVFRPRSHKYCHCQYYALQWLSLQTCLHVSVTTPHKYSI
jgi:hypothetical protein